MVNGTQNRQSGAYLSKTAANFVKAATLKNSPEHLASLQHSLVGLKNFVNPFTFFNLIYKRFVPLRLLFPARHRSD
jgi:hypothetical protein